MRLRLSILVLLLALFGSSTSSSGAVVRGNGPIVPRQALAGNATLTSNIFEPSPHHRLIVVHTNCSAACSVQVFRIDYLGVARAQAAATNVTGGVEDTEYFGFPLSQVRIVIVNLTGGSNTIQAEVNDGEPKSQ